MPRHSRTRSNIFQHIKALCHETTNNLILNKEKLEAITFKSGMKQGSSLTLLLFDTVLETLAGARRQERETKEIQIGKRSQIIPVRK